jgi:hypothetical protein
MQLCIVQARTEFHAFRKVIRPKMQWGWWVEMLCLELQQFYEDFAGCCAPAPSGHVAAVLPRSVMNSRRFIRSNAFLRPLTANAILLIASRDLSRSARN